MGGGGVPTPSQMHGIQQSGMQTGLQAPTPPPQLQQAQMALSQSHPMQTQGYSQPQQPMPPMLQQQGQPMQMPIPMPILHSAMGGPPIIQQPQLQTGQQITSPMPAVSGQQIQSQQNAGIPPAGSASSMAGVGTKVLTIPEQLQRISKQNFQLHKMLVQIMKAQGIQPGNSNTGPGLSSGAGEISKLQGNGTNNGVSQSSSGVSSSPAVGLVADPHRLQEYLGEVSRGTTNIIMEYNALKSRNNRLTKQVAELKQQLKDANITIEHLKSQLANLKK